jgi:hypothetical protein
LVARARFLRGAEAVFRPAEEKAGDAGSEASMETAGELIAVLGRLRCGEKLNSVSLDSGDICIAQSERSWTRHPGNAHFMRS